MEIGCKGGHMDVRVTTSHHAFRLRKIAGFAAWCALIALMLAGSGTASSANPFFFSKTGQDCKFCHQHGSEMSGVEGLNNTGRAFLQAFKRCPDCALRDFAAGNQGNQGAAPTPARPAPAPAPPHASGNQFRFHVCNRSGAPAHIAVSYQISRNPDRFETRGWSRIEPGTCSNLGPYPRGLFWYYAFNERGEWAGDTKLCVDKRAGFRRSYGKGYICRDDFVNFNFHEVQTDQYNWNLTN
jgi:uncharacterized membrane protein